MSRLAIAVAVLASAWLLAPAEQPESTPGVPINLVITAEPRRGDDVPRIEHGDVMVNQGRDSLKATGLVPLRGDRAGLQLAFLLDDSLDSRVGLQFSDLQKFMNAQPETTAILVGYMQNGTVRVSQDFTTDHALAAKSLRLPLGRRGAIASPYLALSDMIRRWPESKVRRATIMISDGIDHLGGRSMQNPYVDRAINNAQRAGVIVYAIYSPGAGHFGHSFWRINWGQNWLSQIADATGGEAYFLGIQAPVSFGPYLDNINRRLENQFLLTFLARPRNRAGFQNVRIRTEVENAELVSADAVWVPAAK